MAPRHVSHYRILRRIAAGAMGVVYLAEDTRLRRRVALKILRETLDADAEVRARALREARAAAAVSHASICHVYDVGETDDGRPFVVMEYVDGESLRDRLAAGPLSIEEALGLATDIAQGLAAAHAAGVIHRDLKPENILVTRDGRARIVDFGLASLAGATTLTRSGTTLGTPAYMAPEQARGEPVDARCDVWSLGAVVHEMLTGRPLFRGEHPAAVLYEVLHADVEAPGAQRPGIPASLDALVLRALERDPSRRFRDGAEMAEALSQIAREVAPASPPPRRPAPHHATPGRGVLHGAAARRRALRIAGAVVVAAAFVLALRTLRSNRAGLEPAADGGPARVAVLPFDNVDGDPNQAPLCKGLTEQLIDDLARLPDLLVVARSAVQRYRAAAPDVRTVANELHVDYVLTGALRVAGERARVSVRLFGPRGDAPLWSEQYERSVTDAFALEDAIAHAVVRALRVRVTPETMRRMRSARAPDADSWNAHLLARYTIDERYAAGAAGTSFEDARHAVERVIRLAPDHAVGYIDMAYLYEVARMMEALPQAREQELRWLRRAASRRPYPPSVDAAMAYLLAQRGEVDSALVWLRAARAAHPGDWESLHVIAAACAWLDLDSLAGVYLDRAAARDPFNAWTLGNLGYQTLIRGDFDRAAAYLERAVAEAPRIASHRNALALARVLARRDTLSAFAPPLEAPRERFAKMSAGARAVALAWLGDRKGALAIARAAPDDARAAAYALLGLVREAIEAIERSRRGGVGSAWTRVDALAHNPFYAPIRADSAFARVLERARRDRARRRRLVTPASGARQ